MPYTPPSHRSPASSASASPDASRRPSLQSGSRPSLPRSASYLSKHRRTPSVSAVSDGSSGPLTPQSTSDDLKGMVARPPSVRQSPPPIVSDRGMPKGAVISPPDSASSGSDDEAPEIRGRQLLHLKDLRDAVSQIPQARTPSPRRVEEQANSQPNNPMRMNLSASALDDAPSGHRKISHVRSVTEPSAPVLQSDTSLTVSDEEFDEDLLQKPQMVRKKSGELVRPALRPASHRRPSSMPGTPVFSKAVHFDSHLEHVRHFLQVDRPLAVSAGSSPVDNYDSDTEYPFPGAERPAPRTPPYEWEILTTNFPHDSLSRKTLPVKLEKVWLSPDQKSMLGSIAVANLAFHKAVTCRFTLDYWKTTSEVAAEYSHEIRPQETPLPYDRFSFSIKLSDTANLESKTLFFCVRYSVNGQEYWDNNGSANFQVDFRKKHLPQNGKNNFQGASSRPVNGLPRSNRRQNTGSILRPKSFPVAGDDFGSKQKFNFDQPIHEYLGESGPTTLRLKTKSSSSLASDNIVKGLSFPSGAAFANRYDFGASLSAAVQAAKETMGKDRDGLYMKSNVRGNMDFVDSPPVLGSNQSMSGTGSPNPSLPSSSYEELVNKYCFYGSKQSNPMAQDKTLDGGRFDGSQGSQPLGTMATSRQSSQPSVSDTGNASHYTVGAPQSPSYFHPVLIGASPNESPLEGPQANMSSQSTPKVSFIGAKQADAPLAEAPETFPERFLWGQEAHTPTAIRG